MKNEIVVIIEIKVLQQEWICVFDGEWTIAENIQEFLKQIDDEIKDVYMYSENLFILDKATQTMLNPYVKARSTVLYHGITLQLF